ncbi:MAG: glycosyltransferase [Candidatus Omnitrophota bacterium]|nr:glycosyltransferase [Candidatus Omnitrophota bacterium]
MNKQEFSIIIPTYNRPSTLQKCIEALYREIRYNASFEVIVVDDGSTKRLAGTHPVFDKNLGIKYLFIEHKGPAAARNFAIQEAKGDVIIFLDDDSIVAESWAQAVIENWGISFNSDGIGGYIVSHLEDTLCAKVNADMFNWYFEQGSCGDSCNFISTCNAGYKKNVLERLRGFDEHFKGAYAEDRDLNTRLIAMGAKLKLAKDILVYHESDLSFLSFFRKHFNYGRGAYQIYRKYTNLNCLSIRNYVDFYKSIICKYTDIKERILVFLLLTLSQIITACGYGSALIFRK